MIKLRDICRYFEVGDETVDALDQVTLDIAKGDYISIMGASGSGKSTLLNMLGLLDMPNSGSYKVENRELTDLSEEKRAAFRRDRWFDFPVISSYSTSHRSRQPRITAHVNGDGTI